jgi:hypothetical protein
MDANQQTVGGMQMIRVLAKTSLPIREVTESSKVTLILKTGHKLAGFSFGRDESVVHISIKEALKQFLETMDSEISISGKLS